MIPKNYITNKEWSETIYLLRLIKKQYGNLLKEDVKKILLVAAYRTFYEHYMWRPYKDLLEKIRTQVKQNKDPLDVFSLRKKQNQNGAFYGIPLNIIFGKNILELMDILTNPKYMEDEKYKYYIPFLSH